MLILVLGKDLNGNFCLLDSIEGIENDDESVYPVLVTLWIMIPPGSNHHCIILFCIIMTLSGKISVSLFALHWIIFETGIFLPVPRPCFLLILIAALPDLIN